MTPNAVTLSRVTFGQDLAAGRQPVAVRDFLPIACAVQPDSAADFPEHLRESANVYLTVKFYDDPRLRTRDLVHFGARTLTVVGVRDTAGGAGRTYVVLCQERRPTG